MKPLIAADILELKTAQLPDPIKTRFVPGDKRQHNTTQENQSFVALLTLVVVDGEEDGTGLDVDEALGD
ncbi:hypothetical protein WN944_000348 [Citrus x changshan-huyou]|uniref:Uncharacterized protein n=1 Tax=Citrus x changshan-huyou TaxID=2935761 RepID=A0AAP0MCP3_9ROSI